MWVIVLVVICFISYKIFNDQRNNTANKINDLIHKCTNCVEEMQKSESASDFVFYMNRLDELLDSLSSYLGKRKSWNSVIIDAKARADSYRSNFQWWLRDAIERQRNAAIKKIKNDYKNSKSHRQGEYECFCLDIKSVFGNFDEETKEFAQASAEKVYYAVGLPIQRVDMFPEETHFPYESLLVEDTEEDTPLAELQRADYMEGREFEYWCAELLRRNGFQNVSVTQGSGDQGVDVLAIKGGIKYAIQCKCYSKDLGNTPIQEVHTGKDVYGCHVGVVMTNRYFTHSAKEAAQRTNTLLWDRDELRRMLEQGDI